MDGSTCGPGVSRVQCFPFPRGEKREIQRYLTKAMSAPAGGRSGVGTDKVTPVSTEATTRAQLTRQAGSERGVGGIVDKPTFEYTAPRGHSRVTTSPWNFANRPVQTTPRPPCNLLACRQLPGCSSCHCHGSAPIRLKTQSLDPLLEGQAGIVLVQIPCSVGSSASALSGPAWNPMAQYDLVVVTQFCLISICPVPRRAVFVCYFLSLGATLIYIHWATPPSPLIILPTAWRVLMTRTQQPKTTMAPARYVFHDLDDSFI